MRSHNYRYFRLVLALSVLVGHAAAQDVEGLKKTNGAGLFCRMIGKGNPLVVVHGGPGLGHDYLVPHFRELSDRFRLIFYDQRDGWDQNLDIDRPRPDRSYPPRRY